MTTASPSNDPLILTVPGLGNSGPEHWQGRWEASRADTVRVELGMWHRPHRNTWVNQLNLAIRAAVQQSPRRPVVLAAHSLGCLAVAWWAKLESEAGALVAGALLVAPPEVDFFPLDERLSTFAPTPSERLPFPSILVASRDDPWMGLHTAERLSRLWGSRFVDAGALGHINAESGLGEWQQGQSLVRRLLDRRATGRPAAQRGAEKLSDSIDWSYLP
jgi:predicted alpha/beta hydrolase family esterase